MKKKCVLYSDWKSIVFKKLIKKLFILTFIEIDYHTNIANYSLSSIAVIANYSLSSIVVIANYSLSSIVVIANYSLSSIIYCYYNYKTTLQKIIKKKQIRKKKIV